MHRLAIFASLYGKARVAGRLYAEDVNQFLERGININENLAKQFGVQASEVKKLVEAGKVGFPELTKALQALHTDTGAFTGGMLRASQTLSGRMATLKDSIAAGGSSIGEHCYQLPERW